MPPLAVGPASAPPSFHTTQRDHGGSTPRMRESPPKPRAGKGGVGGACMAGEGNVRWARMMVRCPIWAHTPPATGRVGAAQPSDTAAGQATRHSPPATSPHVNSLSNFARSRVDSCSVNGHSSHAATPHSDDRLASPSLLAPSPPLRPLSACPSALPQQPSRAAAATEATCAEHAQGARANVAMKRQGGERCAEERGAAECRVEECNRPPCDAAAQLTGGEAEWGSATAVPRGGAGGRAEGAGERRHEAAVSAAAAVVSPRHVGNVGCRTSGADLVPLAAPQPSPLQQSPPQHAALPPPPPPAPPAAAASLSPDGVEKPGGSNSLGEAALPLLDVAAVQSRRAQEIAAAAVTPGASRARGGLWSPLGSPAGISPCARVAGSSAFAPGAGAGLAGYMPSPDWSTGYLTPLMPSPDIRAASRHRPPQGAQPFASASGSSVAEAGVAKGKASHGGSGGGNCGWTAGISGLALGVSPAVQGAGSAGGVQQWSAASSRGGSPRGDVVARSRSVSSGGMLWAEELEAAVSGASDGEGQRIADVVEALRGAMGAESAGRQGAQGGEGEVIGGGRAGGEEQSEVRSGVEAGEGEVVGREASGGVAAAEGSSGGCGVRDGVGVAGEHGMEGREGSEGSERCVVGVHGDGPREGSQGGAEQSRGGSRGQGGGESRANGLVMEEGGLGAEGDEAAGKRRKGEQRGGLGECLGVVREVSRESSSARIMLADAGVAELLLRLLDERVHPPHVVSTACLITLNLALEPALKRRLGGEAAVAQLLSLLQSREEAVCDAAVAAVSSLLAEESNRRVATGMGATGLLAEIVREERKGPRIHKDALIGLFNLSIDPHTREAVLLRRDLVPRVLALLSDQGSSPAHMPAAALLAVMVRVPAVCHVVDGNHGVPVLVQALEDGDAAMQAHVVAVLLQLALTITATRQRIFQEGIIPSLVVLAEGSTGRSRDKAMKLLALLRACEQQSRP
ncbi:hypothetical protein CLOM_g22144 [Closterium sp. NIES-68]|nr:hypothetical protein CLOM_g22144 [Closterium sp. NIES-68]GJP74498.1 hypothetical protein CLOP_g5068 [Closterium sp. NIES-67]